MKKKNVNKMYTGSTEDDDLFLIEVQYELLEFEPWIRTLFSISYKNAVQDLQTRRQYPSQFNKTCL